ncbi:interferon-induced protein 44-like [Alosa pseudoharengus]|uniref:interferon-induced protein 44-like n=1 Tax=Alosa pseudoharengus TaxID=34774 RepID=UPI003F898B5E
METGWCEINCSQDHLQKLHNNEKKKNLRKLQIRNPAVEHLRILVIGPVGAGKSSFIQSIKGIFLDRMINASGTVEATGGSSFTKRYMTSEFKDERGRNLPFVISDVMGLENKTDSGIRPSDIIKALEGHIKEGYKVQACHHALGVPINCIFPVKNYHEERQLNPDMDAVLLFTLTKILNSANDFVENIKEPEDEDHGDRIDSLDFIS